MSTISIFDEKYDDGYYHIGKDVEEHPDATIYIIWSRRGPGKTYGGLRYPYIKGIKTIYMKRTKVDVQTICTYTGDPEFDPSPWKPLNRDFGTNVKPQMVDRDLGLGAFYNCDKDDKPVGSPLSYIMALNKVKSIKGMDFSEADWIIFDEFIPQAGEIVRYAEGEMLLNFYMTINRDRQKRGRPPLKLMLFANAEDISTPITNALEVVDTMAEMGAKKENVYEDKLRRIFFRHISFDEFPLSEAEKDGMYYTMYGTAWWDKTYGGEFSGNDFSNVCDMSIKRFRCLYHLHYRKNHDIYIYINPNSGMYYVTTSKGQYIKSFNLDKENDQKRYWLDVGIDLRAACIEDRMRFKRYSFYDLIVNFKKFYET